MFIHNPGRLISFDAVHLLQEFNFCRGTLTCFPSDLRKQISFIQGSFFSFLIIKIVILNDFKDQLKIFQINFTIRLRISKDRFDHKE